MDEGRPSATALGTALARAAHQILDRPRVLEDPLALRILGLEKESDRREQLIGRYRPQGALRAFLALRSRYAEDELARAIQRGVGQYVILGAGLDTFPYRNPYPGSKLRVYEVDHPATQAWKRRRLHESGIEIPDSVAFAPVDFEKQSLGEGLVGAGFRKAEPAFFSWLGVVIYLTKPAVLETLRFVAALPADSEIVFDYCVPPAGLPDDLRAAHERLARRTAEYGEPWITYFEPQALAQELRQKGFMQMEDLDSEEANRRYFKDRADGLRVNGAGRLLMARV
ncbi:MAG: class I SAM-dependent methyltransferase [Deltaproteobacteria bacterium]|nr:class I SAM-dependent methyltransferase [Deltaproteobacteria bacterium]